MKFISFFLLVFVSLLFVQAGCKKDDDILKEVSLNTKSEPEIRSLMTGRWKIHYSKSYLGTNVCNECYWDITSSDTLTETYNGAFFFQKKELNMNEQQALTSGL